MFVTTLKDGTVLFEVRGDHFSAEWKAAKPTDKLVLDDGRPAVRKPSAVEGITLTTIHRKAWGILKGLPRNRPMVQSRTRLCEFCGHDLKVAKEMEGWWSFSCPSCHSVEVHDKKIIGGTLGAGQKEQV